MLWEILNPGTSGSLEPESNRRYSIAKSCSSKASTLGIRHASRIAYNRIDILDPPSVKTQFTSIGDRLNGHFLVMSDWQIPFQHPKALEFCTYLKRHYRIPDENVYNVGDELDQYWGSLFDKDPDASLTANQEIQKSIDTLKTWYSAFPRADGVILSSIRYSNNIGSLRYQSRCLACIRRLDGQDHREPEALRFLEHNSCSSD